ncbi:hypothetical protein [Paraflavitalea speifideaquila]|uniref:hypothetical protein n=1 Tax=Paraflavitalea speifideaquila TaxID=3076558 RepID=UPI0028E20269|nr:hypothetical protein [Paraflavitalea speifideiaquila]
MHHAGILARASEWVTPVYNSLNEDWRCHDLYRKLVGLGVKLLHQGATKETVQQAAWNELARLGYRTEWPQWELPPELEKWVEEERREVRKSGSRRSDNLLSEDNAIPEVNSLEREAPVRGWVVNKQGRLVFVGATSIVYNLSKHNISSALSGFTNLNQKVARSP